MNYNYSQEIINLIKTAKYEMLELRHPYVGSEHLFLAILLNKNLKYTKILKKYDINYKSFKNELIKVVGKGSKESKWFLFTPLLKKILNNQIKYKDKDLRDGDSLFLSLIYSGDGVALRILFGMNIDIYEVCNLYNKKKFINNYNDYKYLDKIGFNMNSYFKNSNDIILEREDKINLIEQILLKKNRNNILLVGPAGVGKTAIVEEFARRISNNLINYRLKDIIIYNIPLSNLVAGTKYRGEFEEKIKKLLDEISNNKNIVLFIDEFHTIIGAGAADGAIDASNILKPYLANGSIRVIGATTNEEYNKYIEKDKSICRRFQIIKIDELKRDKVEKILFKIKNQYEEYFNINIKGNILNLIIDLGYNFLNYLYQPDSLIDFLDAICAYSLLISEDENKVDNLSQMIDSNIKNNYLNKYNYFNNLIKEQESINNNKLLYNSRKINISENYVYEVLYQISGIPCANVLNNKIKNIKNDLINKYFWEKSIILNFFDCLKEIFNKKINYKKILFVGRKGVGKREILEYILNNIFDRISIIKVDNNNDLKNNYLNYINKPLNIIESDYILDNYNYINNYSKTGFWIFISIIDSNEEIGFVNSNNYNEDYDYVFNFMDFNYNCAKKYINNLIDNGDCKYKYNDIIKMIDKNNINISSIDKLCLV